MGWIWRQSAGSLASLAVSGWLLGCLAYGSGLVLRYRSSLPSRCPEADPYLVFCRAHQADLILGSLLAAGVAVGVGCLVIGVAALVASVTLSLRS
ncbi:MAG: hypothetical protein ACYDGR_07030 [Candidatus Dormibacteria bacterium]